IQVRVAGIIKDFHFEGFERPITPLVLRNRAKAFNYLAIQTTVSGPAAGQLTAQIKNIWKKVNPLQPFTSNWFADSFYERKSATGTVSMLEFLAFIAISIACLGLLGMVIYTTETKVKEVSIRKVMGATAINIMVLLSSGFVRLVLIAVCIALPLGWVCSYMFVSIFTVRAGIGAGVLFIACFIILVAALLVISSQVYKIARSNPVNGLRTE
ncbi:MAG TPA: FtsX-like permease family protein, partial [Chitinophagaceae bacterium]|nr:FtsX-like permease family protein [Chitinophagaceae bacterium]